MNEQTRYRVTGAIFLLAIAIIVLPMVFDGKGVRVRQLPELAAPLPPAPGDAELDALKIPAATRELHREEMAAASGLIDKDGFDTADNTKLGDPALLDVTTLAETETMATSAASEAAEKTVETATATLPASAASTEIAPSDRAMVQDKPMRTAPPLGVTRTAKSLTKRAIWAVQLASFASPANATAFRDRLLKDGFEAWTSTARAGSSVRTRVAIGPLLDRQDAERMRDLVSGRYEVAAIVVHMQP